MASNKNIIRLTESNLKNIITESIKKVLKESMQDWFDDDAESLDIDEIKRRLTFMDKYPHIRQQQSRFNMLYSKYKRILWSKAGIMWD